MKVSIIDFLLVLTVNLSPTFLGLSVTFDWMWNRAIASLNMNLWGRWERRPARHERKIKKKITCVAGLRVDTWIGYIEYCVGLHLSFKFWGNSFWYGGAKGTSSMLGYVDLKWIPMLIFLLVSLPQIWGAETRYVAFPRFNDIGYSPPPKTVWTIRSYVGTQT